MCNKSRLKKGGSEKTAGEQDRPNKARKTKSMLGFAFRVTSLP